MFEGDYQGTRNATLSLNQCCSVAEGEEHEIAFWETGAIYTIAGSRQAYILFCHLGGTCLDSNFSCYVFRKYIF